MRWSKKTIQAQAALSDVSLSLFLLSIRPHCVHQHFCFLMVLTHKGSSMLWPRIHFTAPLSLESSASQGLNLNSWEKSLLGPAHPFKPGSEVRTIWPTNDNLYPCVNWSNLVYEAELGSHGTEHSHLSSRWWGRMDDSGGKGIKGGTSDKGGALLIRPYLPNPGSSSRRHGA